MRLSERRRQAELMDDPSLDAEIHRQALMGLRRVNWWSRTDTALWTALIPAIHRIQGRPVRILDIGSGGGDQLIRLALRLHQSQIPAQLEGWDISPEAVQFATEQAHKSGFNAPRFLVRDCIHGSVGADRFDIVMCSLFLHHLDESDAIRLLGRMKELSDDLVVVDDLRRTTLGYWLAWAGCRILTRCHIVHMDGPMSVEGAFTTEEARSLALQAGLTGCSVNHHWPQRFLLTWSRS